MTESLRQPKDLDPIDEESLAVLGHGIERWDILHDSALSFEQKKRTLISGLKKEIGVLEEREHAGDEGVFAEIENLYFDLDDVEMLEDDKNMIELLYDKQVKFYAEGRTAFIKEIQ